MADPNYPPTTTTREQFSLLLPVYAPTLILAFASGMLVPVLPLYVRSFDVSYGMTGVVLASQGIGALVGDVPSGVLLGRLGDRLTMMVGIASIALAMLAMSWAQSVPELALYGFIAGFGNALWGISRHAYMTEAVPNHRRGRATATFGGIGRIGAFLGPAVGGMLATRYGMHFTFQVYAVAALFAFVLAAFFVHDPAVRHVHHRGGLAGHGRHLYTMVRTHWHALGVAGSGQLLAQMIRSGRQIIVPLYGAEVIGLSVGAIGWIVTLSALVDMAMFPVAGFLMDGYGRKYSIVPSFAIQALGMALIPFTSGYGGLLAATLVIGFGNGIGSGTMLTLGSDLAPKESMGEFLGVWRLIGDAGATGAPIVVGSIADLFSLAAAALVIAGTGVAAAWILGMFVPETLRKHSAPAPKVAG